MAFITRINQLFTKPDTGAMLGVAMQQQALVYCSVAQDNHVVCDMLPVNDNQYPRALAKLHHLSNAQGQCHLVLSAKQNQIVQIDRPQVPAEEINAAVKWQIKDLVTIAPEDMVVDYFDGPKLAGGLDKINVVCANKHDLIQYVEQLNNASLLLKTITIEEFAFASLFPADSEARLMVCKQPNEDMLLLIVKEGCLYFHRRLRGLERIEAMSEHELGLGIIDSLSLEIQRSTDYFERQLKQAPVRSIEVLVPMENEAYLARRLAENTNVEVKLFEMPEGYSDFRAHSVCIGATMLKHGAEVA